jgi:hypothetical protein
VLIDGVGGHGEEEILLGKSGNIDHVERSALVHFVGDAFDDIANVAGRDGLLLAGVAAVSGDLRHEEEDDKQDKYLCRVHLKIISVKDYRITCFLEDVEWEYPKENK